MKTNKNLQGHPCKKILPGNNHPNFRITGPIHLILHTQKFMINLDQTQTKHHASSAIMVCDMEIVCRTGRVSRKDKFAEMTISK